jgi:hypothetical protein
MTAINPHNEVEAYVNFKSKDCRTVRIYVS